MAGTLEGADHDPNVVIARASAGVKTLGDL